MLWRTGVRVNELLNIKPSDIVLVPTIKKLLDNLFRIHFVSLLSHPACISFSGGASEESREAVTKPHNE
jgi:hypothetical protein